MDTATQHNMTVGNKVKTWEGHIGRIESIKGNWIALRFNHGSVSYVHEYQLFQIVEAY